MLISTYILFFTARSGSRNLQALTPADRANIIHTLADQLVEKSAKIMEANQKDLVKARSQGIEGPLYDRLVMTPGKLSSLAEGLKQIAESSFDNLGRIVRRTKISETMSIVQKTVSIGVLLVIFESRPDCLPQVLTETHFLVIFLDF